MDTKEKYPQPFVKWVGGKRQLLEKIKEKMPKKFEDFYEPFVGGGAVLFNIQTENKIFINDINKELINTYNIIKNNVDELMTSIDTLNSEEVDLERYLFFRESYNNKVKNNILDIETAALFIILNKYCFNGVYRVNKKGLYNVPWNKKSYAKIYDKENFLAISNHLSKVSINTGDFIELTKNAKAGDFIFFDSPYAPLNDTSFDSYTKTGFLKEDHERLAEEFKRLDKLGAYIMLTNHNTDLIRDLYKDFKIEEVNVKRLVNSDAKKRMGKEVIITNY